MKQVMENLVLALDVFFRQKSPTVSRYLSMEGFLSQQKTVICWGERLLPLHKPYPLSLRR